MTNAMTDVREITAQLLVEYAQDSNHHPSMSFAQWLAVQLQRRRASDRWIPVSERLPPYGKRVLVTVKPLGCDEYVAQDRWREGLRSQEDFDHWGEYSNVIAWRPLPAPYDSAMGDPRE